MREIAPRRLTSTCQPCVADCCALNAVVDARRIEDRRIEDRVRTDEALVGEHVARVGGLDQQHVDRCGDLEPPHRPARQHYVVAGTQAQVPEIAVEIGLAVVHEQQFVAVRIARELVHALRQAPEAHAAGGVREHLGGRPGTGRPGRQLRQVERTRTQRTLELGPARRRVPMVEERGRAEEPFLAHLAFVRAFGQVAVRLPRGNAFDA